MATDLFPTALRGYDKDKVNEAFANYERTISRLREQVRSSDESILQLQAQLQEEKNNVKRAKSGNTFASLCKCATITGFCRTNQCAIT